MKHGGGKFKQMLFSLFCCCIVSQLCICITSGRCWLLYLTQNTLEFSLLRRCFGKQIKRRTVGLCLAVEFQKKKSKSFLGASGGGVGGGRGVRHNANKLSACGMLNISPSPQGQECLLPNVCREKGSNNSDSLTIKRQATAAWCSQLSPENLASFLNSSVPLRRHFEKKTEWSFCEESHK